MLLFVIAAWAVVTGIFQIIVAIRLHKQIRGEWPPMNQKGSSMRTSKTSAHGRDGNGNQARHGGAVSPQQPLQPGTEAPNFELLATPDQKVDLHHFRGRPVVLVFYPADWSPVCGDQLALYNEILPEFNRHNAQLVGISVDGVWCHTTYAQQRKLHFPLLADFEPKGQVARQYGVYRHGEGVCERALFVIDADGIIRWSYVSPLGVNPGADGILSALESLDNTKPSDDERPLQDAKESAHA